MKLIAKLAVKLALWCVAHPDVIKELVDALHAAKQPKATAATP